MIDFQWIIGGEAGYGIMTTGTMMAKIASRMGLSVFDYVEYPSLIRGGHNAYYVRASSEQIYSQKKSVDIIVALNKETIELHRHELSTHAVVLYNSDTITTNPEGFDQDKHIIGVPFITLAQQTGAEKMMMNTVAVGASLALLTDDFTVMADILKEAFGSKGDAVVALNQNCAKAGFDYVKNHNLIIGEEKIVKKEKKQILIGGSEAIGMGAIRAGLKFAAIYPMTPITSLMTYLVSNSLKYSFIVKEPEDEISGINMAIGASYTGVRSMTATSGGGFSLMVEGMGLAAQTEVPIVIVLGTRPGPATGMPTWTDQGDLRFVLHAHQGDLPRIVIAPGDALEAFAYTMHAFNLAEKYQLPVVVMVDKYLNEGHFTLDYAAITGKNDAFQVERGKWPSDEEMATEADYKRYLFTDDGISPRSRPGQKGGISLTGSDEHDEKGLYDEKAENRIKMMQKRFKKLEQAVHELPQPDFYGNDDSPLTIVAFGTSKMPILEAMKWLAKENISVNFLKVSYLSPFPTDAVKNKLEKAQKTLVIEGNYTGQFEGLIKETTGIHMHDHLRKYDGRPFYPEEIVEKVKSMI